MDTAGIATHPEKYARVERERRFLVSGEPIHAAVQVRHIVDRYFSGTRLRLRLIEEMPARPASSVYKLTQKIPGVSPEAGNGLITNIYLSEAEYKLLSGIEAAVLTKTRHSIPPMGVDVFEGPLTGLIMAEAEFESAAEMRAFTPPDYAVAEVTNDPRFTGGRLVSAAREDIIGWLADYGVSLRDPVESEPPSAS